MDHSSLKTPSQLETKRLILRPYRAGDGQTFYEMVQNDNKEHLKEILGYITETEDVNKIETWIQGLSSDWYNHVRFVLSFWEKSTEKFLGHIWIEPTDWKRCLFEIGWFIDKNHQGQGFVTEATRKALEFIFIYLHANKVIVKIREIGPYNLKSKNVAERCGFTKERFFQNNVKLEDNSLISETHYGMLKKVYKNKIRKK